MMNKVMVIIFIILEVGALYIIAPVYDVTKQGFGILLIASALLNIYVAFGMTALFGEG